MASIVLGAAGAYVGSIFGGPLGASIGWSLGSYAGSLFDKPKGQEGPRLTDLHIQNSQYGVMIPIAWGTVRIAGNVIWQTDLQEHSQKSGGKGGGPTLTTYTYSCSFAVLICEGPIVGISRIWANRRLVWSAGANNTFPFTLYLGTATQMPDPTMEADKGVGFVSAHRGYAYIVFDDIPMEPYGNAIPSLEFEVIRTSGVSIQRVNQWSVPQSAPPAGGNEVIGGIDYDGTYFHIALYTAGTPGSYQKDKYTFDGTFVETETTGTIDSPNPDGGGWSPEQVSNSLACALYCPDPGNLNIKVYWAYDGAVCSGELTPPIACPADHIVDSSPVYDRDAIFASGGVSPNGFIAKWNAPGGIPDGTLLAYYATGLAAGHDFDVSVDNDGDVWGFANQATVGAPRIFHFDSDLKLIAEYPVGGTSLTYQTGVSNPTVYNGYIVSMDGNTYAQLAPLDGVFAPIQQYPATGPTVFAGGSGCVSLGGGYFLTSDGVFKLLSPVTLKSIVDDLSDRSGLLTGEYETTELTQLVNGYVIGNQSDVRSMLEPLMTAYFCDAVESGPAIKYVNRGAAPDETIDDDDLAAYMENEQLPAIVNQTRQQEVDLPRTVNVSYFDLDADYQIGTQVAKRAQIMQSTLETSIAFALVLSPQEGKQIADRIMYDSWAKRRRISFSTARKWSKLEPTDVKIVHGYTLCLTQRDEGQGGVLRFDGVATRSQIFGQSGQAGVLIGSGGFTPPTPPTGGTASLLMLDLPLIQDGDYPNGYYAAISGSFGSANLYKSTDGGTTYNSIFTTLTPDTVGQATTVLGDFGGGNVFDNINSVTVRLNTGTTATLSSATELAVLNGANEALIGSEIIQYKTATLTGTLTYDLTGLLRGRRGTDWAMSTHAASEDFVVLPTNVNVNGPTAELGLARLFKAVPAGGTLAAATAVPFTNTGIALKPYAPVHLGGGRNAAGDIALQWVRRTRIGGAWLDYIDAPLSEAAETYRVQFYTTSSYTTIAGTTYVGTQSADVLVADQTLYFGSPQSTLYWDVAQLGDYGYGYAARGIT